MEAKATITKITAFFAIALVVLALLGLLFRATLYWKIPVVSGEPAGLGDIIEMLFYFAVMGVAGLVIAFSVIVALLKNYRGAIRAFLVGVVTPVAYYFLYSYMPRLL